MKRVPLAESSAAHSLVLNLQGADDALGELRELYEKVADDRRRQRETERRKP